MTTFYMDYNKKNLKLIESMGLLKICQTIKKDIDQYIEDGLYSYYITVSEGKVGFYGIKKGNTPVTEYPNWKKIQIQIQKIV